MWSAPKRTELNLADNNCQSFCQPEEGHADALARLRCWRRVDAAQTHSCSRECFFLLRWADIRCTLIWCSIHSLIASGLVLKRKLIRLGLETFLMEITFASAISLRSELLGKKICSKHSRIKSLSQVLPVLVFLFRAVVRIWSKSAEPPCFQGTGLIYSVTLEHTD